VCGFSACQKIGSDNHGFVKSRVKRVADFVFVTAALFFESLTLATAQGNLVVNGGFDLNASGWTTNAFSGYYEPLKGDPGGCFTLLSSPAAMPTISQPINGLVPGANYVISGSYSIEGGNIGSTPSLGVAMNSTFVFQVAPPDYNWHNFNFPYLAASSSAVLSLAAHINGTSNSYRVDNIVMQPVPSLRVRIAGANVMLSWPTNTIGFSLQTATNLNAASWVAVTNAPAIVSTNYSVALSAAGRIQFFRLKR
jgi:hypothetical protein